MDNLEYDEYKDVLMFDVGGGRNVTVQEPLQK